MSKNSETPKKTGLAMRLGKIAACVMAVFGFLYKGVEVLANAKNAQDLYYSWNGSADSGNKKVKTKNLRSTVNLGAAAKDVAARTPASTLTWLGEVVIQGVAYKMSVFFNGGGDVSEGSVFLYNLEEPNRVGSAAIRIKKTGTSAKIELLRRNLSKDMRDLAVEPLQIPEHLEFSGTQQEGRISAPGFMLERRSVSNFKIDGSFLEEGWIYKVSIFYTDEGINGTFVRGSKTVCKNLHGQYVGQNQAVLFVDGLSHLCKAGVEKLNLSHMKMAWSGRDALVLTLVNKSGHQKNIKLDLAN